MKKGKKPLRVIVSVRGGVAEVETCPDGVEVVVIDHDNLHENIVEALGEIEDLKFAPVSDREEIAGQLYDAVVRWIKEHGNSVPLWEIVEQVYRN